MIKVTFATPKTNQYKVISMTIFGAKKCTFTYKNANGMANIVDFHQNAELGIHCFKEQSDLGLH